MNLITRSRPSLKCVLGVIRPYSSIGELFGDVVPFKMQYVIIHPLHCKMLHVPVRNYEPLVPTYHLFKRSKYTKRDEESSDSEDEVESVEDVGKDFKVMRLKVNSLRADLILKAALGIARNKIEAAFFQSKIRVNGDILMKKSSQVNVEDEVDLVRGVSKLNPGFLVVSRIKLLSYSQTDDKYIVNVQCFRSLTIENYADQPWKTSE